MPRIRLAILECDQPAPGTAKKYGSYGNLFKELLSNGAKSMGRPELSPLTGDGSLETTQWDVVDKMEYPDLDAVDALLLTGSKHTAFDDIPWINKLAEYTRKALDTNRVRIIGVCFGHQILGRALGAKVGRNEVAWEVAVNNIDLTPKGKELFGGRDILSLHQLHRDIVFNYPPGVEELGSSPVCKVQGMYAPKRLISVQGHPEFNREIEDEILTMRHALGVFDDKLYADGMSRTALPHDGVVVSKAFVRFLLEE